MNNLLGVLIIRGRFSADVQKTTRGPFSGGPWLRERLREPLHVNSFLKTSYKLEKPLTSMRSLIHYNSLYDLT